MAIETEDVGLSALPSYLIASSIHTQLNGGAADKGIIESSLDLVTKGIPATLVAAGNEIANIPATVGNFLVGEGTYDITSTATRLSDIDSDLAQYYEDHKLGVDTAGFIVGILVPGMAGTKVLRAGQVVLGNAIATGKMGSTTASALGLLVPSRETHIAAAVKHFAESGDVFSLTQSNLLRAMASGVGQNALEGAAWTLAVNATMNQSPILDQRTASDLAWDVLTGAGIGGAVGGVFSGVGAAWKVKGAVAASEKEVFPWTVAGLGGTIEAGSASDKILWKLRQLDALPPISPEFELAQRAGRVGQQTTTTLQQEIRTLAAELTDGDQELATLVNQFIGKNDFSKNLANLLHSQNIVRVPVKTALEKEVAKVWRATDKLDMDAVEAVAKKYHTSYINLRTMTAVADEPTLLNLADHGTPVISNGGVKVGSRFYQGAATADVAAMGHLEAEARYAWMEKLPKLDPQKVHVIAENDIPKLQKAIADGATQVNVGTLELRSLDELALFTKERQATIAAALKDRGLGNDAVAKIVNADEKVLFGGMENSALWNQRKFLRDTLTPTLGADPHLLPSHMKILTKASGTEGIDGNVLEGMAVIEQKQLIYQQTADTISAGALGEVLVDSTGVKQRAIGATSGATLVSSEGGNYGSQSSFWAFIGQRTHALIKKFKEGTQERFTSTLQQLAIRTDDAIEWSVLNEKMRNLPQGYIFDGAALVRKSPAAAEFADEIAFSKALDTHTKQMLEDAAAGIPARIEIKSPLVRKLVEDHIVANDARRSHLNLVHANNGYQDKFIPGTFYPIPRNPKDTPHFAFVIDESVGGRGHSKMIYAKDAATLEHMRNELMSDPDLFERGIRVLTKGESEAYYKSIGQYEFERTLSDNYINNALARKGKSASFLPLTDPQRIVNDFLDWHTARDASFVRTMVEHKYAQDFATLRQYAAGSLDAAKSKFGYISPLSYAENTVDNPAANLIKMALDISKADEYPLWTPLNKFLDGAFSNLSAKVSKTFGAATSPQHLDEIHSALKKAGYQDVVDMKALYEASNAKVERGALTSLVNRANSILATFALRTDPFNALNNAVGSSVLLGTELKSVLRAIEGGNAEAVGELAKLAKVKVPGTTDSIFSPAKLIAKRIGDFHSDKAGREWFKQHGFISSITDQYDQTLDALGVAVAKGDATSLQKAMGLAKGLGDKAEQWSANKLAEEFNRYVAAGVMKDITDIAIKHGALDEKTALSYINTFVNRTQGNYLASQRPVLFQGPLPR